MVTFCLLELCESAMGLILARILRVTRITRVPEMETHVPLGEEELTGFFRSKVASSTL